MKMTKKTVKRLKAVMKGKMPIEKLKTKELILLDYVLYQAAELMYADRMAPSNDLIH